MNLIYSSDLYCIVAYPAFEGFELYDKASLRTLFLHGAQANRFRHEMECIAPELRDREMDALLQNYCAGVARPIVLH